MTWRHVHLALAALAFPVAMCGLVIPYLPSHGFFANKPRKRGAAVE